MPSPTSIPIREAASESPVRHHPDLFTSDEALAYLRVQGSDRTLRTLREEYALPFTQIGHETLYHRRHLDQLVERVFGLEGRTNKPAAGRTGLKIAGA